MSDIPINPIQPAAAELPFIYYAIEEKVVPNPQLAAIGFILVAMTFLATIGAGFVVRRIHLSPVFLWGLVGTCEHLLLTAGYIAILLAFRFSPLRRNWLHLALLGAIAAEFLLFPAEIAIVASQAFFAPAGSRSPLMWTYAILSPLLQGLGIAITLLWMIFLSRLARAMRSSFLHIATLILLTAHILFSCLWTFILIDSYFTALGLIRPGPPLVSYSSISVISAIDKIVSVPMAALFVWYAVAVYRYARNEGSATVRT